MINIYTVPVRRNPSGLLRWGLDPAAELVFKGRMRDRKTRSGRNMKRFHKRRQVVATRDIKALSLSLCLSLSFFSFFYL